MRLSPPGRSLATRLMPDEPSPRPSNFCPPGLTSARAFADVRKGQEACRTAGPGQGPPIRPVRLAGTFFGRGETQAVATGDSA